MTEVLSEQPFHSQSFSTLESQSLFLDFEQELNDLLNPVFSVVRRSSRRTSEVEHRVRSLSITPDTEYEGDGTVLCSNLNHAALCQLAGTSNLADLKTLSLCISCRSSFDNLSVLAQFTVNLTTLKLDHSKFQSMRTLGDDLPSLKTISVCDCGLTDLDGITSASNLITLVAANNFIEDLLPVTELRKMNVLDLQNNVIDSYDSVSFLFLCPNLETLVLKDNPVSEEPDYRARVFGILPSLKNLDVVVFPRVIKELCRQYRRPPNPDDESDGGNLLDLGDEPSEDQDEHTCSHQMKSIQEIKYNLEQKTIHLQRPVAENNRYPGKVVTLIEESPELVSSPDVDPIDMSSGSKKLLARRQSQDPLKLVPPEVPASPQTFDHSPNLASFMFNPTQPLFARSDSPLSIASLTCSASLSDSGIDSSKQNSEKDNGPMETTRAKSQVVNLEVKDLAASILAKGNEEVKSSDLSGGTLRTEGDIEIEEFDL
ncbi:uncharacterized protein LOC131878473 [Tigriopus californicus]|nr:uncharacterized protein LOC131878473 [Tigriopus californicus]